MKYENKYIVVSKPKEGVALLTLTNPPLNVVTLDLTKELYKTLRAVDKDEDVRVVVLTGCGTKSFCAGADIKEFPHIRDEPAEKKMKKENETFNAIEFLEKPVIAAMEGTACGAGVEIAIACDLRVLSVTGRMALPEANIGVIPGSGGIFRLPKLIGPAKALEMMYLGEFIDAEECRRLGLVNWLAPAGETVDLALRIAEKIVGKSPESIRKIKAGVRELWLKSTAASFYSNLKIGSDIFKTSGCVEGVAAFFEKRPPKFV